MKYVIHKNGNYMPVSFMPKIKTQDRNFALSSAVWLSRWFEDTEAIMKVIRHYIWLLEKYVGQSNLTAPVLCRMHEIKMDTFIPCVSEHDMLVNFDGIENLLQSIIDEDYMQAYVVENLVYLFVSDSYPKKRVQKNAETFMCDNMMLGKYLFIHNGVPDDKLLESILPKNRIVPVGVSEKFNTDDDASDTDVSLWMISKLNQIKIPFPLKADSENDKDALSAAAWFASFGERNSKGYKAAIELINALISSVNTDGMDEYTLSCIASLSTDAKPATKNRIHLLKQRVQNAMNHRYFCVRVTDDKVVVNDCSRWDRNDVHSLCKKVFPKHEIILPQ